MQIAHSIGEIRSIVGPGTQPTLVPTMGSLHEGHLSLIRTARRRQYPVVATIFVNRLQFAPAEDFDQYPRSLARDEALLERAGCDVLFAPSEDQIYPELQEYRVTPPARLGEMLEGHFRPGFFAGVCTVVLKLFNIVQPAAAVFGKKDYQQFLIVRDMVRQMALPIEVIGGETVREADELAMSSRNAYLRPAERVEAPQLQAALRRTGEAVRAGRSDWSALEREASDGLRARGWKLDYVAIRRQGDLHEPAAGVPIIILAAAKLGATRLIDNLEMTAPTAGALTESRGRHPR